MLIVVAGLSAHIPVPRLPPLVVAPVALAQVGILESTPNWDEPYAEPPLRFGNT